MIFFFFLLQVLAWVPAFTSLSDGMWPPWHISTTNPFLSYVAFGPGVCCSNRNKTGTVTLEAHNDTGFSVSRLGRTARHLFHCALCCKRCSFWLLSQTLWLLFAHEMKIYWKKDLLRHMVECRDGLTWFWNHSECLLYRPACSVLYWITCTLMMFVLISVEVKIGEKPLVCGLGALGGIGRNWHWL